MQIKFTLLPLGENFDYQGERYSKTGPLTASHLQSGRQRMIPRSAMVTTRGVEATDAVEPSPQGRLAASAVIEAFGHYHNGCLDWLKLAEQELSPETSQQIREALEQARLRLLAELKQVEEQGDGAR